MASRASSALAIFLASLVFLARIEAAPTYPRDDNSSGNSTDVQMQNGLDAQSLNRQFANMTSSDSCQDGTEACINGSFAQCTGTTWQILPCSTNTTCRALPLVNKPGTVLACDFLDEIAFRFQQSGAPGGITGQDNSTDTSGDDSDGDSGCADDPEDTSTATDASSATNTMSSWSTDCTDTATDASASPSATNFAAIPTQTAVTNPIDLNAPSSTSDTAASPATMYGGDGSTSAINAGASPTAINLNAPASTTASTIVLYRRSFDFFSNPGAVTSSSATTTFVTPAASTTGVPATTTPATGTPTITPANANANAVATTTVTVLNAAATATTTTTTVTSISTITVLASSFGPATASSTATTATVAASGAPIGPFLPQILSSEVSSSPAATSSSTVIGPASTVSPLESGLSETSPTATTSATPNALAAQGVY